MKHVRLTIGELGSHLLPGHVWVEPRELHDWVIIVLLLGSLYVISRRRVRMSMLLYYGVSFAVYIVAVLLIIYRLLLEYNDQTLKC